MKMRTYFANAQSSSPFVSANADLVQGVASLARSARTAVTSRHEANVPHAISNVEKIDGYHAGR